MPAALDLPDDIETLKQLLLQERAARQADQVEIQSLKLQLAHLRRLQFGQSSEQISEKIAQLELALEDLEAGSVASALFVEPIATREKSARRPLPSHLPREHVVHEPPSDQGCTCPACGGALKALGEDVSEVLEYTPAHFKVIRHVRPKLACARCDQIVQANAPSRPIARGLAGPALLAHVLVSKFC